MKTLVPSPSLPARHLLTAACAAAALLGIAAAQPSPSAQASPELKTAKPPSAVFIPAPQRIVIDRKALAAAAESEFLKRLTAGFLRRCSGKSVGCAIAAVGPNGMWSEER